MYTETSEGLNKGATEVIGRLRRDPLIQELAGKRLGLVLSGGGAKGAFQAGCLQTLHDLGIDRFHCICGTSVGALNGAAAGSGKIPELVRLWETISFFRVFKPSWRVLFSLVGELIAAFFYVHSVGLLVIGLLGILIVVSLGTLGSLNCLTIPLLLFLVFVAATREFSWRMRVAATRIKRATRASTSMMENSPLRLTLEGVLYPDGAEELKVHCPTFVTVARDGFWFDPDYPTFWPRTGFGFSTEFKLDEPRFDHGWLPNYIDITTERKNDLLDVLLESAALPFAFRRTIVDGVARVDGGVIDNVPLNKVLESDCDVVIVIYLSSDKSLPTRVLSGIPWLRRSLKLAATDQSHLLELYLAWKNRYFESWPERSELKDWRCLHDWELPSTNKPTIFPMEPLNTLPSVMHVVPSKSLGGLVRGTLNFRKSRAKRLLKLGREDMLKSMQHYLGLQPGP